MLKQSKHHICDHSSNYSNLRNAHVCLWINKTSHTSRLPDAELTQVTHNLFQIVLMPTLYSNWSQTKYTIFKETNLRVQIFSANSRKICATTDITILCVSFVYPWSKVQVPRTNMESWKQLFHNDIFIPADDYWDPVASKTENLNRGHANIYRLMTLKGNAHSEISWKISVKKKK